jgi:hypothetical protein
MGPPERLFLLENLETHVKLNSRGKVYLIILQIKFIPLISSFCPHPDSQDFQDPQKNHRNKFVALFLENFYRDLIDLKDQLKNQESLSQLPLVAS